MDKKLKQVTDNIHDTIYLSALESEMISTPYFYRLHDIYQSSTVYMTFPSNRTKRYEHSLGTMEIASEMLYSAVSNADDVTRKALFKQLKEHYGRILNLAIKKSKRQSAPYYVQCKNEIDKLVNVPANKDLVGYVTKRIRDGLKEGCFNDTALDYFQFYPMGIGNQGDDENVENVFLYRCLLQAVRIVALFHDVGHPPYSHILEKVIEELYEEYENISGENERQQKALEDFRDCLREFVTDNSKEAYVCQAFYSETSHVDDAFHERVGLFFIEQAISDVLPNLIKEISNSDKKNSCKIAKCIYYIVVVEFAIAMLAEESMLFKSLHKIVDGFVDADRLDYIMRDSLNSGVDWGRIPYKRVINSARLFCLSEYEGVTLKENNSPFVIAYPKKVADDIEDLLLVRYKIFARINFHHRCMKTSVSLQTVVKELVEDYLESDTEENCINPDISVLWKALDASAGNGMMRVIQWNDSWLISTLHKALVKLDSNSDEDDLDSIGEKADKVETLKKNLEEILLLRKRNFTLFKRGKECKIFMDKVFECAGITEGDIRNLEIKEQNKLLNNKPEKVTKENILYQPGLDADDSLDRIAQLRMAKETGGMEYLCTPIPLLNRDLDEIIKETLDAFIKDNRIIDFKIHTNKGKKKDGIPQHRNILDEIYLYDGNTCFPFDDKTALRMQIEAIERNVPWNYIYFVPVETVDIEKLANDMMDALAEPIGKEINNRFQELFGKRE